MMLTGLLLSSVSMHIKRPIEVQASSQPIFFSFFNGLFLEVPCYVQILGKSVTQIINSTIYDTQ